MSSTVPSDDESPGAGTADPSPETLLSLLTELPAADNAVVLHSAGRTMSLHAVRHAVDTLAGALVEAGVRQGVPVGGLVGSGASGVVTMFAVWAAGGVYVPINRRSTPAEIAQLIGETPVELLVGDADDLARQTVDLAMVQFDAITWQPTVLRPVAAAPASYDPEVALVLRTSGTTGRPKAVQLRHGGTLAALDSSLRKLRRGPTTKPGEQVTLRVNLIPLSLALWAGIFNTLFSLRAGFGVVLLDTFTPTALAEAVRRHGIKSTVLAPAMITALCDSDAIDSIEPLHIVRSITAPLSPATARRFHDRFGGLVLNSYGQTELGGEVVGWTVDDIREFGTDKLGAAGRPYDDVDVRVVDDAGRVLEREEQGHIHIRSPFRMRGYATTDGPGDTRDDGRFADGFIKTGDIGRLDADGFLWIEGRMSDMINRGGLKVFPDEVEEVLRRHDRVRDAAVAGVPDPRLGEVPHAWIVPAGPDAPNAETLSAWCRDHLAPYKIPVEYTVVAGLPRSDVGKVLRRELRATVEP
jgi:acyl-CoA synthetase (AMP-forming)/AMP-acid ligase II